jgi:steroid delta-isomerase-like uncharacterized protein
MATDSEKMMNDYVAAWNSHDMEKVLSFCTDDVVFEEVPMEKVWRGKKEAKDFAKDTFTNFPDFKIEVKSGFSAGAQGAGEWVMSGTFANSSTPGMPATGKRFSVRGTSIIEFREGKISRESMYWNLASFLQQVGLMPGPPQ